MPIEAEQLKSIEKILRTIPTTEKIFRSSRRVQTIPAVDAVKTLSQQGYASDQIKEGLSALLRAYRLVKVRSSDSRSSDFVDFQTGSSIQITDTYMWTEDKINRMNILIAIGIVFVILLFVMFQVWPAWLKRLASYSKYPIGGFILFLFLAAIVRAVVFSITYFSHPPGLWLLPNLFAECGFFESFVPAYAWGSEEDTASKNK